MAAGQMPLGNQRNGVGSNGTSGVWKGPDVSKAASYQRGQAPAPMDRQGGKMGGATNEGSAGTRGPVM